MTPEEELQKAQEIVDFYNYETRRVEAIHRRRRVMNYE
jgi:hypothetical protein